MAMAIHLIIHGRVQGVGYRAWTKGRARAHGLTGWVRNRTDGTVEAVLCGAEEAIQAMREECHDGPLAARVDKIEETMWTGEHFTSFEHLQTA